MKNWIEIITDIDLHYFGRLKDCSHAYDEDNQNIYHMEHSGNVWGHTLDVYKESQRLYPEDDILHLACLLHDIAKPDCREEIHEKKRVSFYNHESLGVFKALEILQRISDIYISRDETIRVLKLIQRHADSYKLSFKNLQKLYTQYELEDIIKIRWCDTLGREKIHDDGSDIEQIKELESKIHKFKTSKDIIKYDPDKPTINILVGPPCSGKSTWVKNNYPDYPVLPRDNVLMKMSRQDNYNDAWKHADQDIVDTLFSKTKNIFYSLKCTDFIIDMTNMSVKSRNKLMNGTKENKNFNYKFTVFLTSYENLYLRNSQRAGKVLDSYVIENMCKRFQMPYDLEGQFEVQYVFS